MLHIMEVKWKRNQIADMIYKDFYPFYASFANPMLYRGEMELEREFSLMKSYYPETARKIQEKVEEECDLLDYEGSRMYDEYPDRYMLYHLGKKIVDEVKKESELETMSDSLLGDLADENNRRIFRGTD